MKRRLEDIRPYIRRHKFIADLGVGPGYYWSRMNTKNAVGVDQSQVNISRLHKHSPDMKAILCDVRETGLPDKTYDLIIMSMVLEHIEDYNQVLDEAKRICKDDGFFLVALPVESYHKYHYWPVWTLEDIISLSNKLGELRELKRSPDCWLIYVKKL